jgi:hypothetical protein
MKSILELRKEIASNKLTMAEIKEQRETKQSKRHYNKLSARNKYFAEIILYLELDPSEDYLQSECERVSTLIKVKEDQYRVWVKNNCPQGMAVGSMKSLFKKQMGLHDLYRQLDNIRFILSN